MNLLRRYPLTSFVLLAIAISWVAAAAALRVADPAGRFAVDTLAKFGPSLAGLVMLAVCEGSAGPRRLLTGSLRARTGIGWWAAAIVGPLVLWCAALLIWQSAGAEALSLNSAAALAFVPLFLQRFFLGGGLGEEIGWRGFMLARLLKRRSPLVASLVVGLCWGLWHAPAFWGLAPGKQGGAVMLALFGVYTVALAVLFTVFWLRSGGSVLLCCVLHASLNATENWIKALLPAVGEDTAPTLIYAGLILILALGVAVTWWVRGSKGMAPEMARAEGAG